MYLYSKSTGGFYTDEIHDNIPSDAVQISDADYQALLNAQSAGQQITSAADGQPQATDVPLPSSDELLAINKEAVKGLLDAKVKERDYDSIESACSYATSTVDAWHTESLACAAWRDEVWQWFYSLTTSIPRADVAKSIPQLTWPK